jgi:hypothetical protein
VVPDEMKNSIRDKITGAEDTVVIYRNEGVTLSYTKKELEQILEIYPALDSDFPVHPDIVYAGRNEQAEDSSRLSISFSSEVGQDEFYCIYAWFVRQKNGEQSFNEERDRLVRIYRSINSIFGNLSYGGTYFGHLYQRIIGYAEYSVHVYSYDRKLFEAPYDITKQKELFLKYLRQKISDELNANEEPGSINSDQRRQLLYDEVNELSELITNHFYLRNAQEFLFSNY